MTTTERLCELLDERGVEWRETALGETRWLSTVLNGNVSAKRINDKLVLFTGYKLITPEQAIAATLGESPCLPHFWTHDGTLHVELPKLPESISVRLSDQRDREVCSARVWQYTLGDTDATSARQGDADLAAENDRLREELESVGTAAYLYGRSDLKAENAKLRELLARVDRARRDLCDAYPDAEMLNCEECPAWSACRGDIADRMRELGIEVDG